MAPESIGRYRRRGIADRGGQTSGSFRVGRGQPKFDGRALIQSTSEHEFPARLHTQAVDHRETQSGTFPDARKR